MVGYPSCLLVPHEDLVAKIYQLFNVLITEILYFMLISMKRVAGWMMADPICSMFIAVLIVIR